MSAPPTKGRARTPDPRMRFAFDDGDAAAELVEVERQLLVQHAAMAASADAGLRIKGRRYLDEAAELLAWARAVRFKAVGTAKRKRPAARVPIREAAIGEMRSAKRSGVEFLTYLQGWERDRQGVLSIRYDRGSDKFQIHDGDEGTTRAVTLGTLRRWWTDA